MEYTDENKIDTDKIHCELLYMCNYIQKPNSDELYTILKIYERESTEQKWNHCYADIENIKTKIQEKYLLYSYSPDKCHTQLFFTIIDKYRDCKGFSSCENWKEQHRLSSGKYI